MAPKVSKGLGLKDVAKRNFNADFEEAKQSAKQIAVAKNKNINQ